MKDYLGKLWAFLKDAFKYYRELKKLSPEELQKEFSDFRADRKIYKAAIKERQELIAAMKTGGYVMLENPFHKPVTDVWRSYVKMDRVEETISPVQTVTIPVVGNVIFGISVKVSTPTMIIWEITQPSEDKAREAIDLIIASAKEEWKWLK